VTLKSSTGAARHSLTWGRGGGSERRIAKSEIYVRVPHIYRTGPIIEFKSSPALWVLFLSVDALIKQLTLHPVSYIYLISIILRQIRWLIPLRHHHLLITNSQLLADVIWRQDNCNFKLKTTQVCNLLITRKQNCRRVTNYNVICNWIMQFHYCTA